MFLVTSVQEFDMTRGPKPRNPRPDWSTVLRARRASLDLKQEDITALTNEEISQGTVSDLERGKVELANMSTPRLLALASALQWTLGQMETETGVHLNTNRHQELAPAVKPGERLGRRPLRFERPTALFGDAQIPAMSPSTIMVLYYDKRPPRGLVVTQDETKRYWLYFPHNVPSEHTILGSLLEIDFEPRQESPTAN